MDGELSALLDKSMARTTELADSIQTNSRALEELSGVIATIDPKLNGVNEQADLAISTSDRNMTQLDQHLDSMLGSLQQQMETTGMRANQASAGCASSIDSLNQALSQLLLGAGVALDQNDKHLSKHDDDTKKIVEQIHALSRTLDEQTAAAVNHVIGVHDGIADKHSQQQQAIATLQQSFTDFSGGVDKHGGALKQGLDTAAVHTQKELEAFQRDLEKQLTNAITTIKRHLDTSSNNVHKHGDHAEEFLDGLIAVLKEAHRIVHDGIDPPVKRVGDAVHAAQPVINLLGLLHTIGLL